MRTSVPTNPPVSRVSRRNTLILWLPKSSRWSFFGEVSALAQKALPRLHSPRTMATGNDARVTNPIEIRAGRLVT